MEFEITVVILFVIFLIIFVFFTIIELLQLYYMKTEKRITIKARRYYKCDARELKLIDGEL